MSRLILTAFLLVAVALAGCSDGGEVDTAPECDAATHFIDGAGACTPHVEPAIIMSGLPDMVEQFYSYEFTWSLDPGTRGMETTVHSMDSRILVSTDGIPPSNTTGPDDWGVEVARQQHQNLPQNFTASFSADGVGTYYLQGFMLIDGKNVWTDLGTVNVSNVQPTGTVVDITITDSPQPSLESTSVSMKVGDAVRVVNDHPLFDYSVVFTCNNDVTLGPLNAASGASSDSEVILVPANCDFVAKTAGSNSGATQGDRSGKLNINKP